MGAELIVILRPRREEAYALDLFDLLEEGDVALGDVRRHPDIQNAQRQTHQNIPSDKAQIQHEQLPLEAQGLGFAHVEGLHDADLRVFTQVQHSKAVAVGRHDAGDHQQQRPQGDEDDLHDIQQNDLPDEGEAIEQGDEGHLLTPTDAQVVQGRTDVEHYAQQRAHDRHEPHRKSGERPVQRQEAQIHIEPQGVDIGELVVHLHIVADAVDDEHDGQQHQRKQVRADLCGFQQRLGLPLQGTTVKYHTKIPSFRNRV